MKSFRSNTHRRVFLEASRNMSSGGYAALAAVYLLTADCKLWNQVKHCMFKHVKFKIWNETDGYWVTATRNDAEGVYYVTGHVTEEADATVFYPVTSDGSYGKIIVKGLEDDEYVLTEIETANGYDLHLSGIPQEAQIYNMLTASATVDGNAVQMREDNGSANAEALLKVVNNPGFDLPDTGDNGTMMLSIIGIVIMAGAALGIFMATRKKPDTDRK